MRFSRASFIFSLSMILVSTVSALFRRSSGTVKQFLLVQKARFMCK